MKLKKILAGFLAIAMVASTVQLPARQVKAEKTSERNALTLWYDEPASQGTNILNAGSGYSESDGSNTWQQQTLPIGNGDMGANVYGEIASEHLTFNEKTLWTGGPSDSRTDYMGGNLVPSGQYGATMKQIQQYFIDGNSSAASNLCNSLVGTSTGYGAYQAWGDIYFDYADITEANVTNYERALDLTTAVSTVNFTEDGTDYTREFFVSHPDNVLVGRLEADGSATLNLDVRFTSKQGATAVASGQTLELAGEVSDNQMQYASYLTVVNEGGTVTASGSKLTVTGATAITVYVSAATDYKNDYPEYRTGEDMATLKARVKADVDAASEKDYAEVKADHLADYKKLFDRVELDLGQTVSDKTTDQLLAAYKAGTASDAEQRQLEVILFQYGRYLTIASSREDSQLPSNLQGVWNCLNSPPWSSDYHMNVNLQMNYWPTYSTNLAECALPLIDYVDSLREPGRVTAAIYAGVVSEEGEENGFMAHTQNTPFGWTCPGWSFSWGWSPAAVPWILQNCWEYYEYTGNLDYMKNYIYPMMKEEAKLYDQMLIDENGKEYVNADGTFVEDEEIVLVSSPSYSPEHGPYTAGNTYEQTLIWQLYEDVLIAAELVGETDTDLIAGWEYRQEHLKGPIEIGDDGQIKEWYEETTLGSVASSDASGHRHLSHMLGLFPGDLVQTNEDWIEAARVSMDYRTDESTGWGMGQRINTWARLGDGNKAHELIQNLFKGGIYPNLWDAHTPFQIDGNFGMTSGVAEMLVQSNMGYIDLLPALPDAWADGSVDGLVARGNFEISMKWEDKNLTEATILSNNGGTCIVEYATIADSVIVDEDGKAVALTVVDDTRVSFETTAGVTYTVEEIPEKIDAPMNGKAYWAVDEAVITFDAVLDAESYIVYESTDGENYTEAAVTKLSDTEYRVTNYAEGTTYKVQAVIGDRLGEKSSKITPKQLAVTMKIDDRDSRITYSSGWGNWTDSGQYESTEKYSTTVGDTAQFYFYGNTVRVIAMTNVDCHTFDLYVDGELKQENADTNGTSCQRQQTVAEVTGLAEGLHKVTLVVKQGKISLDAFEFEADVEATALEISGKDTFDLYETSTLQLEVSYKPDGATGAGVNWAVDDESVATIDENGLLTAVTTGVVVVTATDKENSALTANKTITITKANTLKEIDPTILAANAIANSEMSPSNGSDGGAAWAFDDENHWWHSRWGAWDQMLEHETVTQLMTGKPSESNPIWIQTGFDKVWYIDHVTYTSRDNLMGGIMDYTVSIANLDDPTATPTDDDFVVVKSGTLSATSSEQTIQLDEVVAATHIRITVTETYDADNGGAGDGHLAAKNISIFGYAEKPLVEESAVIRLYGADRYGTSFAVAEEYQKVLGVEEFDAVIVATGKKAADALSGSYLAAQKKAPILLTEPGKEASLIEYVKENLAAGGKVYLLGGTGVVSEELETDLGALGYSVKRLKGTDRYGTNLAILEEAGITGNDLLVATGEKEYDSLSASATNRPILLVKTEITEAQKAVLEGLPEGSKIWILGGTGAVSEDIEAKLKEYSNDVERVKGADRYATSVEIAKTFFGEDAEKVTMAYGENFPDGLCGGPLAAEIGAPVLLVKENGTDKAAAYAVNAASGYVFGGTGVIADETVKAVLGEDVIITVRE